jgi:trehalose/maltose hydrolase-like predicted phosphorylase
VLKRRVLPLPDHIYPPDPWRLVEARFIERHCARAQTIFAVANGFIGMRGTFEEGRPAHAPGTLVAGFHETWKMHHAEEAFGLARTGQTIVSVPDATVIKLYVDDEPLFLPTARLHHYERVLDLRSGVLTRELTWATAGGRQVVVRSSRLVSLEHRHVAAIHYEVVLPEDSAPLVVFSEVVNRQDAERGLPMDERSDDPRLATTLTERVLTSSAGRSRGCGCCWATGPLTAGCVGSAGRSSTSGTAPTFASTPTTSPSASSRRSAGTCSRSPRRRGGRRARASRPRGSRGRPTRATTSGTPRSTSCRSWPTLSRASPATSCASATACCPRLARARELNQRGALVEPLDQRGALFAWRTINGEEASAYYQAGTAQYHINADIAYAVRRYAQVAGDEEFLLEVGAEILVDTARLWEDLGFYDHRGRFHIHGVTGPDEYTTVVNDNAYTNLMARMNLNFAAWYVRELQDERPAEYRALAAEMDLQESEVEAWVRAADAMYVPFDPRRAINPQDANFLEREVWDLEATPPEHFPLLLHYHPLVI